MSQYSYLQAKGLTNSDSEDLGAIAMGKRMESAAFCYSPNCAGKLGKSSVRVNVRGYPSACPKCGWALKWSKVHTEQLISPQF